MYLSMQSADNKWRVIITSSTTHQRKGIRTRINETTRMILETMATVSLAR